MMMWELLISGGITAILSAVIFAVRPLREAFLYVLDIVMDGPRRFATGLLYIAAGRKNPRIEELRIDHETALLQHRIRQRGAAFRKLEEEQLRLLAQKRKRIREELRLWQIEFVRLADPQAYARHIAPYEKTGMNVLNYPEVGTHASLGLHAEAEQRVQRTFSTAIGATYFLLEPNHLVLEVSERRWDERKRMWGHYKRYSNGSEFWTYDHTAESHNPERRSESGYRGPMDIS